MKKPTNTKTTGRVKIIVGIILTFLILFAFCYLMDYPLVFPVLIFYMGLHLRMTREVETKTFINLAFLLTLIIVTAEVIHTYTTIPSFYVPLAGISILVILLFKDLNLAFGMTFLGSLFVTWTFAGDFGMFITYFLGGVVGAYSVRDARTRGQLINAGLFISLTHVLCLFLLRPTINLFIKQTLMINYLYPLIASGFISAFLVAATLKVFEYICGVITNYSLLELSDFNQPLLKRMILEAPGTYHHSLLVSNLSEAAADAIGANALLTRVGAYYHDIGKIAKAEYFTENQLVGGNKHDRMEPSMSRLVILNHVKEGIELAKKNKLNKAIIDFIPQHHGTGLMYYFYQKALEEAQEGEIINEENYRYPGPKPQSRETAITLMADSVEGATRALDDPNASSIKDTVQKIINNKFIDGQLDECPLTLKEINKISETFTRILTAMYHGRVKYPEKKDVNHNKKSSEKNNDQPPKDKDAHSDDSSS